jgi:hypothetical protein
MTWYERYIPALISLHHHTFGHTELYTGNREHGISGRRAGCPVPYPHQHCINSWSNRRHAPPKQLHCLSVIHWTAAAYMYRDGWMTTKPPFILRLLLHPFAYTKREKGKWESRGVHCVKMHACMCVSLCVCMCMCVCEREQIEKVNIIVNVIHTWSGMPTNLLSRGAS